MWKTIILKDNIYFFIELPARVDLGGISKVAELAMGPNKECVMEIVPVSRCLTYLDVCARYQGQFMSAAVDNSVLFCFQEENKDFAVYPFCSVPVSFYNT